MHRTTALIAGLLFPFVAASWASAEATATLEKTHLCCNSCVKGAAKAVGTVAGATAKCDMKAKTVTITASDAATAQKAIDALIDAGFTGKATGAAIKEDAVASGNVKTLTLSGLHNCCGSCAKGINAAIKKGGATGEIKSKEETVTVTGDFDAAKLIAALSDAGYHAKVSK